ncbi:MAG: sensor histidine kinase, partial [Nocardioidaceae bacterium]
VGVRRGWRKSLSRDRLVAAAFVGAAAVEAVLRHADRPLLLAGELAGAAGLGTLAQRRRRPLLPVAVLAVLDGGASVAQAMVPTLAPRGSGDVLVPIVALIFANYSLGVFGSRPQLLAGAAATLALITVVDLADPSTGNSLPGALVFFTLFVIVAPMLAGRLVRGRSAMVALLAAQAAELEDRQRTVAAEARARERVGLTDRLHEHLVTGMERLLGDIRGVGDRDPQRAAERVELRARALLAETRDVVVALSDLPAADAPGATADPGPAPTPTVAPEAVDALPWTSLAAAALAVGLLMTVLAGSPGVPLPLAAAGCLLLAAPLVMVWARPLLVTVLLWLLAAGFTAAVLPLADSLAGAGLCVLGSFLVAVFADRARAVVGLVVSAGGLVLAFGAGGAASAAPLAVLAWLAGAGLHERGRLVHALRHNNALLAEQLERLHRAAAYDERARVARELHDAVGHSLTVIALQAGGARRVAGDDPGRAAATLDALAGVADEGLRELRRGFVGPVGGAGVAGLVAGARSAGLDVRPELTGDLEALGPESRGAVYRVVQEALTNVLRHAPGAAAQVTVRVAEGTCLVEVRNGAPTDVSTAASGGHGLAGMRRRVEACGGWLRWSDLEDGGFVVRAELPLAAVPA